jgi:hypothetical protein
MSSSKESRQRKHIRRIERKVRVFTKREWDASGLQKELSYCTGKVKRPEIKTGRVADKRVK